MNYFVIDFENRNFDDTFLDSAEQKMPLVQ